MKDETKGKIRGVTGYAIPVIAIALGFVLAYTDGWLRGHKSRTNYDSACAKTVLSDEGNTLTERSRNLLEQVADNSY